MNTCAMDLHSNNRVAVAAAEDRVLAKTNDTVATRHFWMRVCTTERNTMKPVVSFGIRATLMLVRPDSQPKDISAKGYLLLQAVG